MPCQTRNESTATANVTSTAHPAARPRSTATSARPVSITRKLLAPRYLTKSVGYYCDPEGMTNQAQQTLGRNTKAGRPKQPPGPNQHSHCHATLRLRASAPSRLRALLLDSSTTRLLDFSP